jgi:hypothetical protein
MLIFFDTELNSASISIFLGKWKGTTLKYPIKKTPTDQSL